MEHIPTADEFAAHGWSPSQSAELAEIAERQRERRDEPEARDNRQPGDRYAPY